LLNCSLTLFFWYCLQDNEVFDHTQGLAAPDYCEIRAKVFNDIMLHRTRSSDPRIRKAALYEGCLSVDAFGNSMSRPLSPIAIQKSHDMGYRLLEFGNFWWEDVVDCLRVYLQKFGDLAVPREFKITDESVANGFPKHCVGLDLGDAVMSIRIGDTDAFDDPTRRKMLDDMGFDWGDRRKYLQFRFVPMWLALRQYFYLEGDTFVDPDFVIPHSPEWPLWMCGIPLGKWCFTAKRQYPMIAEEYPERQRALLDLEFDWDMPPDIEFGLNTTELMSNTEFCSILD
jgi:hypothetical protein